MEAAYALIDLAAVADALVAVLPSYEDCALAAAEYFFDVSDEHGSPECVALAAEQVRL